MSNVNDLQDQDKNVYRIIKNKEILVRFPVWLIKETYSLILNQLCKDSDIQRFSLLSFYKFMSGNSICYKLPNGGTSKRHITNVEKSRCHNHNMSRFETIEFFSSEFTRVIMEISYFLILIDFCKNKKIMITRLFYNENEDIVLVANSNALSKLDKMDCCKEVFLWIMITK